MLYLYHFAHVNTNTYRYTKTLNKSTFPIKCKENNQKGDIPFLGIPPINLGLEHYQLFVVASSSNNHEDG